MSIDEVLEYFLRMPIHNNLFELNQYFENHVVSLNLIRTTERLSINELPDAYDRYQSRNLRRINNYSLMTTTGDGNCLWNAVSNAIFGNESYMKILRLFTFYVFINHQEYFNRMCNFENNTLDFYMRESLGLGVWGRDIHILGFSLVLQRPIYVYAKVNSNKNISEAELERGRIISASLDFNRRPILIHFSRNHYETILPHTNNLILAPPNLSIYESLILD